MRKVAACLLVVVALACGGSPGAMPEGSAAALALSAHVPVYDDTLAAGWQDWSWVTHNLANSTPVSSGTKSISVSYGPWTGLSFALPGGVSGAGAGTLEFDVDGGATANPAINAIAQVGSAWGPEVPIAQYCAGGAIPSNAFAHCKVPLTALHAANVTFVRIAFKEAAGRTLPRVYFDQIAIVPPSAPAIQSFTASASSVVSGTSLNLSATYSGGTGTIDPGVGAIASGASVTVSPTATTTYTLTVSDGAGQSVSSAVTVTVTAPAPAPSGQALVYDDRLAAGWQDWSWVTHDLANSAPVSSGTKSISVSYGPWTGLSFLLPGGVSGAGTGTLEFDVDGGATLNPAINAMAQVGGAWQPEVPIAQYCAGGAIPAGAFTHCAVPLAALKAANVTLERVAFKEARGLTLPKMYFDQIAIVPGTTTAPPPTPAIQSFTGSASNIVAGGSVTLSAAYSGGTGTIDQGVGAIASGASVPVSPAATTTYTLTVSDTAGHTATAAVTVTVGTGSTTGLIPAQRLTAWKPGIPGGVPARTTVCATVNASTYSNGSVDATAGIQAALDACPEGQVVQLSVGDFRITSPLLITKGIVLRGAGSTQTRLNMPVGIGWSLITLGTQWGPKYTQSVNLAADAAKETSSVTLASNPGLAAGEVVQIDQLTDTSITEWSPTRSPPGDVSRTWFTRPDRPIGQVVEIQSVSGNVVTFTTPLHIDFKTAFKAQLSRFSNMDAGPVVPVVKFAGIENLYVHGGGDGNIRFSNAAYSWVKNVESDFQKGESIALDGSFRCIVRDSYFHSTQDPNPGGGGYGISFSFYSSDNLVENNIVWNMNKVMVMRASGGGNVIAYNYMEDGWISYATGFVEVGLNASHMTTPHYELFEGNQAFNFDGDNTWGNAVYITVFRNHLTGKRRSIAPLQLTDTNNVRAIGLGEGHLWYSFVGNVLGSANQNPSPYTSYIYETSWPWNDSPVGMWRLGYNNDDWNATADPRVTSTVIREGNFDYATNQVHWSGSPQPLPSSLYLSGKPAFFGSSPWPWIDPTGTTKVATLPARARFDACGSTKTFCP